MKISLFWAVAASTFHVVSADECFNDGAPFHPGDWKYCQTISETLYMYYTPMEDTVMLGLHITEDAYG
jgi:hypothetical protein